MAVIPQQYVCDVCGVRKGENNHWFIVYEGGSSSLTIYPWQEASAAEPFTRHVCGQRCAHTMLDWWFQTGKLEKPTTASADSVDAGRIA